MREIIATVEERFEKMDMIEWAGARGEHFAQDDSDADFRMVIAFYSDERDSTSPYEFFQSTTPYCNRIRRSILLCNYFRIDGSMEKKFDGTMWGLQPDKVKFIIMQFHQATVISAFILGWSVGQSEYLVRMSRFSSEMPVR